MDDPPVSESDVAALLAAANTVVDEISGALEEAKVRPDNNGVLLRA